MTKKGADKLAKMYIKKLKQWQDEDGDWEIAHGKADTILCCLLDDLDFSDVVREYEKVPKWNA